MANSLHPQQKRVRTIRRVTFEYEDGETLVVDNEDACRFMAQLREFHQLIWANPGMRDPKT